jgi:hypothetical protein
MMSDSSTFHDHLRENLKPDVFGNYFLKGIFLQISRKISLPKPKARTCFSKISAKEYQKGQAKLKEIT